MESSTDPDDTNIPLVSSSKHAGPSIEVPPGISKNAAKKLARKQKLEATKHQRRAAERLKKKENKRARFLAAQNIASDSSTNPNGAAKRRICVASSTSNAEGGEGEGRNGNGNKKRKAAEGEKKYFNARLVIDCGFDELMVEKESSSMTQQLMYLYSANRNAKVPFGEVILTGQDRRGNCLKDVHLEQLSLVPKESCSSTAEGQEKGEGSSSNTASIENIRIGQAMEGKLRGVWRRWKRVTIYRHGGLESLLDPASSSTTAAEDAAETTVTSRRFPPEETRQALHRIRISDAIYLTADTDDTLEALELGKTYIIGGIVDKNRYKGLCRAKADRLGIRAAKLPLSQEMMQAVERNVRAQGESIREEDAVDDGEKGFVGRKVLTVNQVVEILTAWTETRDWVKALEKALPRRKLKQRGPVAKPVGEKRDQKDSSAGEKGAKGLEEDQDALKNES
ncbi:hypothetical protein NDA18_004933 [Ustilago nuda]|nr:hypothetical protein NDA18_004933 [Ustilago nuda]